MRTGRKRDPAAEGMRLARRKSKRLPAGRLEGEHIDDFWCRSSLLGGEQAVPQRRLEPAGRQRSSIRFDIDSSSSVRC
jgi:hypothetical protein